MVKLSEPSLARSGLGTGETSSTRRLPGLFIWITSLLGCAPLPPAPPLSPAECYQAKLAEIENQSNWSYALGGDPRVIEYGKWSKLEAARVSCFSR